MEKKYNLNLKKVLLMLIIALGILLFVYYIFFIMSDEERRVFFASHRYRRYHRYTIRNYYGIEWAIIIGGFLSIPTIIYMIELLVYKINGKLVFSNEGITYYTPEYGKVFIPKDKIEDISITEKGHMKIKLKNYEIPKKLRARFWTSFKNWFLGSNAKNIFRIDLSFIKCDIKEVREDLMQFNLDPDSKAANQLVKEMLEKYNYNNIEDLKNDEKALSECIIKLYNMERYTQIEISSITKTSRNKVSKTIKKWLN